jgi:hypothetical protein
MQFARVGAEARLQELEAEAASIRKMFPGLRSPQPKAVETPTTIEAKPKQRKRSRISAEARAAIGDRMRAYWAKRRQEKHADEPPMAEASAAPAAKTTGVKAANRRTKKR